MAAGHNYDEAEYFALIRVKKKRKKKEKKLCRSARSGGNEAVFAQLHVPFFLPFSLWIHDHEHDDGARIVSFAGPRE